MKDLIEVIVEFLNTSSISDTRRILEQHPELLSVEADSLLNTLSECAQSEETIKLIQTSRNFLAHCQEVGIPQAFEEISRSTNETSEENLQMILKEIVTLSRPEDMPRRIMLLHSALSLVLRQSYPELWAALHVELGNNLYINPTEIEVITLSRI